MKPVSENDYYKKSEIDYYKDVATNAIDELSALLFKEHIKNGMDEDDADEKVNDELQDILGVSLWEALDLQQVGDFNDPYEDYCVAMGSEW